MGDWQRWWPLYAGLAVGVILALVILGRALLADDGGRALDVTNLPELYTGETVDVDGDGSPDVALFGSPDAPEVHQIDRFDIDTVVASVGAAVVTAGASIGAAWLALSRRGRLRP